MEICQFCKMYMKPFVHGTMADCEFCGKTIAEIKKVGGKRKWVKINPLKGQQT